MKDAEDIRVNPCYGFSIIEYMVSMVLLLIIFAIVFEVFLPIAKSAKSESGNIQTQIEGILGLELLRRDIVHAGVGLPWAIPAGTTYTEATGTPESNYNDASDPPRAIIAVNGDSTTNPPVGIVNSDFLVIKAAVVADVIQPGGAGTAFSNNPVVDRWTLVQQNGVVRVWNDAERDPSTTDGDRVIVLQSTSTEGPFLLTVSGGAWFTTFANPLDAAFSPTLAQTSWYAYAISSTDPAMPFNRAEYYISMNNVPNRCVRDPNSPFAPVVGVLVKRILYQDGTYSDELPLLDCVADFQIALGVDNINNGVSQRNCMTNPSDASMSSATIFPTVQPPNASSVRNTFKEVRLYILAQEGNKDLSYGFDNFESGTSVRVGEESPNDCDPAGTASCNCGAIAENDLLGQDFDLSTLTAGFAAPFTTDYLKYHWRVYRLTIKPEGLTTDQVQ